MPKNQYVYPLSNGHELVLDGDEQPTDQEVEQAAESMGMLPLLRAAEVETPGPTAPTSEPSIRDQIVHNGKTLGVIGAGTAIQTANRTVRPALAAAGRVLATTESLPGIVGGTLGASVGGTAGAVVGGFPIGAMGGATLGAELGRRAGRSMAAPIKATGTSIAKAFASDIPRVTIEDALASKDAAAKLATNAKRMSSVAPRSGRAIEAMAEAAKAKLGIPRVGSILAKTFGRKAVDAVGGMLPAAGSALSSSMAEGEALSRLNDPNALRKLLEQNHPDGSMSLPKVATPAMFDPKQTPVDPNDTAFIEQLLARFKR